MNIFLKQQNISAFEEVGIYFLYFHVFFEQNMGGFEKIGSLGRLQNGGGHKHCEAGNLGKAN